MGRLASVVVASSLLVSMAEGQVVPAWSDVHHDNVNQHDRTFVDGLESHPQGGVVAVCTVSTRIVDYPPDIYHYQAVRSQLVRWSASGQKLWVCNLYIFPLGNPFNLYAVDTQGVSYVANFEAIKAVSPDGVVAWTAPIPPGVYLTDLALSPTGQIVATGRVGAPNQNFHVSAWSSAGAMLWSTTIDGPHASTDRAQSVACAADGDIVVAGTEHWVIGSVWDSNVLVARLDAAGNLMWSRSLGSTPGRSEEGDQVVVTDVGDAVVAGHSYGPGQVTYSDNYMVRLDSTGATRWELHWLSTPPHFGSALQLSAEADGSTWSLMSRSSGSNVGMEVFHHAADGTLLGSAQRGPGPDAQNTWAAEFARGSAGQIHVVATTWGDPQQPLLQDGLLLQYDRGATVSWELPFEATNPQPRERFGSIARTGDLLVVGGTNDGNSEPPGGVAQIRAFDVSTSPQGYCEGKVNSLGCTPQMVFSGMPSATATSGFVISATQALNQRRGMLIYSTAGAASVPFAGGLRCIAAPIHRRPVPMSGGSALPANDCSGAYEIDWNAYAHGQAGGNPDPALTTPGTTIWVQAWGRDPGFLPPEDVSLSNGMRFVVLP